jgi:hypothetical protein
MSLTPLLAGSFLLCVCPDLDCPKLVLEAQHAYRLDPNAALQHGNDQL